MKKDVADILMTEVENPEMDMFEKIEEYKKYDIEYHEPYFEPVMMIVGENDSAIPYFYLGTDINRSEKLKNELNEYNKSFWYYRDNENAVNPFKGMAAAIKYNRAVRKLEKVEKAENIKCYSRDEMNKYIENYKKEKEAELKKAKAIINVAKEEMELEK